MPPDEFPISSPVIPVGGSRCISLPDKMRPQNYQSSGRNYQTNVRAKTLLSSFMNQRTSDPRGARLNSSWYRREAERLRERAATPDDRWRESCMSLASEYERLAEILESNRRSPFNRSAPVGSALVNG